MDGYVKVGTLSDFPDGELTSIDIGDAEIVVARVGDQLFALDNLCSHAESWLDMGRLHPVSYEVECPLHEGRFDLRTGAATHLPCREPVRSWPVRIDGDDVLIAGTA